MSSALTGEVIRSFDLMNHRGHRGKAEMLASVLLCDLCGSRLFMRADAFARSANDPGVRAFTPGLLHARGGHSRPIAAG